MLTLVHASFATVSELFGYKKEGLGLEPFPGYTNDQWGIKAHNRPWIVNSGNFKNGQRVVEVGGAYSTLPKYLAQRFSLDAWVADDFGLGAGDDLWTRWGDPKELPRKHPNVRYTFENFGSFSELHPSRYFDRVFSVSTLEHIPVTQRLQVIRDMNRCLAPGGRQLHSIDIRTEAWKKTVGRAMIDRMPAAAPIRRKRSEVAKWMSLFEASGMKIAANIPRVPALLDRNVLVESPDVVYRFYPPNDTPKDYRPAASLLLIIEDV